PIPNREVKLHSADGTWGEAPWESRTPPGYLSKGSEPGWFRALCVSRAPTPAMPVRLDGQSGAHAATAPGCTSYFQVTDTEVDHHDTSRSSGSRRPRRGIGCRRHPDRAGWPGSTADSAPPTTGATSSRHPAQPAAC